MSEIIDVFPTPTNPELEARFDELWPHALKLVGMFDALTIAEVITYQAARLERIGVHTFNPPRIEGRT